MDMTDTQYDGDDDLVLVGDPPVAIVKSNVPISAQAAFQDYRDMGPSRSVTRLHGMYLSRLAKDPYAPVPTDDVHTLAMWEGRYSWRTLAWEFDAEADQAYAQVRKERLHAVYSAQTVRAHALLDKADEALKGMLPNRFSPDQVLRYATEASKMRREAEEALIRLEDPKDGMEDSSDVFDLTRSLIVNLVQTNNLQQNFGA